MVVFDGAYQKWGGGAGPQLWKKIYHFVRLLPFDSEYHNIFFEFICSELSKAQYIYQQVLFIGSVTFLWLLLSICWSIGRAVGYNFLEGLKVTLPCSYKSTCLLKLRILMTMTTITITITTRQASGLCPLATAESSTTTSTTRLSIPSTSLTGIRCPTSFYDLWESSAQGIYEAAESFREKSSEDRPLYLNKYKKKMCNECCFSIKNTYEYKIIWIFLFLWVHF